MFDSSSTSWVYITRLCNVAFHLDSTATLYCCLQLNLRLVFLLALGSDYICSFREVSNIMIIVSNHDNFDSAF